MVPPKDHSEKDKKAQSVLDVSKLDYKILEEKFTNLSHKMREQELSLTDLNQEERDTIKYYLKG